MEGTIPGVAPLAPKPEGQTPQQADVSQQASGEPSIIRPMPQAAEGNPALDPQATAQEGVSNVQQAEQAEANTAGPIMQVVEVPNEQIPQGPTPIHFDQQKPSVPAMGIAGEASVQPADATWQAKADLAPPGPIGTAPIPSNEGVGSLAVEMQRLGANPQEPGATTFAIGAEMTKPISAQPAVETTTPFRAMPPENPAPITADPREDTSGVDPDLINPPKYGTFEAPARFHINESVPSARMEVQMRDNGRGGWERVPDGERFSWKEKIVAATNFAKATAKTISQTGTITMFGLQQMAGGESGVLPQHLDKVAPPSQPPGIVRQVDRPDLAVDIVTGPSGKPITNPDMVVSVPAPDVSSQDQAENQPSTPTDNAPEAQVPIRELKGGNSIKGDVEYQLMRYLYPAIVDEEKKQGLERLSDADPLVKQYGPLIESNPLFGSVLQDVYAGIPNRPVITKGDGDTLNDGEAGYPLPKPVAIIYQEKVAAQQSTAGAQ